MIERLFGLVKVWIAIRGQRFGRKSRLGITRKSPRNPRNRTTARGVYRAMKRDSSRLLAATIRTGIMVAVAMLLILVLLPAALAAQAAGLR